MSQVDQAPVFAALGDATRLKLLIMLSAGGQRSIASLSAGNSLTRQAITKHLQVLEAAGLVSSSRSGRENLYMFRAEPVAEAIAYLDGVSRQWEHALGRLQAFLG